MTVVFIAGSITIKSLDTKVQARIVNMIEAGQQIIVGDADGVDKAVQAFLTDREFENVTIYCSGSDARNNLGRWPVKTIQTNATPGTRAFFTAKDLQMSEQADFGLMIWDTKSTGTLSNVLDLARQDKIVVVFANKTKVFYSIKKASDIDDLVGLMAPTSLSKAEQKIQLSRKIERLKNKQDGFSF